MISFIYKNNFVIKLLKAQARSKKQMISQISVIFACLALSACQLTPTSDEADKQSAASFSHYYLWIKNLNNNELLAEEKKQKNLLNTEQHANSQSKLILIYSLPYTPLHKPYKAKELLNEHLLNSDSQSKENIAFTMILRDQLNYQLTLLSKKQAVKQDHKAVSAKDQELIDKLQTQLNQVNQQLVLLKKIDKNINNRK